MCTRAQIANPNPRAKSTSPRPARHGSVLRPWLRNAPKRIKRITTTAITALMRSSRDHGTRPLFVEKAATSQYSQNAAQPTAKTSSVALVRRHRPATALHVGQRCEPSSAVDHPGGATSFASYSTAVAPHGQSNTATLLGIGAGVTK
jgi:hypothetical protein